MGKYSRSTLVLCYCPRCNGRPISKADQVLHAEEAQVLDRVALAEASASFSQLGLGAPTTSIPGM
jgi:hypothetical protein